MLCTETSISNLKPLDLKVCGGEAVFACGKTSECWMVLEVPSSQGVITIKDFLFLLWFVQKNKNGWWSGGRAEIKHTTTLLLSLLTLHHSFTQSRFRFVYLDVGLFAFFFCEKKKKHSRNSPKERQYITLWHLLPSLVFGAVKISQLICSLMWQRWW